MSNRQKMDMDDVRVGNFVLRAAVINMIGTGNDCH